MFILIGDYVRGLVLLEMEEFYVFGSLFVVGLGMGFRNLKFMMGGVGG